MVLPFVLGFAHPGCVAMRRLKAFPGAVLMAAWFGAAAADEGPSVTPYRPSVSTPAALSAPGWLEVELGALRARAEDPPRRNSLPYTLKLAFTPDWGVRVGGDAWVHQVNVDGGNATGGGDTVVVLKHRLGLDDARAFGLELSAKAPTARAGIGSGHPDYGINGIYCADFASDWHTDINLTVTQLGGTAAGTSAWQAGWAAELSRAMGGPWSMTGEVSGTSQRGAGRTSQLLVAGSYAASRRVALDFGATKGLRAASDTWSLFAGITFLTTRLF